MRPMNAFALLATLAIGLTLIAGCSTTPKAEDPLAEKTYLDDKAMESFDNDLRQLSSAIQRGDENSEMSLRTKISEGARTYQRALVSALHDDSSTPRRAMAGILLGFTGDAAVISALLSSVGDVDEDESVRVNSALGLAALDDKLRDYKEHKAMMAVLRKPMSDATSSVSLRRATIQTYAVAYDAAQLDTLQPVRDRFLGDPDMRVQIAAVNALGDIGDSMAVPDLVSVGLRHPQPEIRAASAIALGRIPDPARCIPALVDASRDESALTRRESMDALSRHYGSNPELVYGTLVNGLSDFDSQVRESSALALARVRDTRAIEPLLQATGDRTAVVREAAVSSLGELITLEREKEAYPLIDLLGDNNPGVSSAALTTLTRITRVDHGNDQPTWRGYFWKKYPELNPALAYEGKPKPRASSGIQSSGSRTGTSSRNTGRTTTQPRTGSQTRPGSTTRSTNNGRTTNTGRNGR